ncbi:CAP domain-containing protein [Winogradskyella jejuensis]|uniref:Cysteine-rich secretory protein family protein n=1 Tax=Winogradskyella jejuensis TaxID=1089305 RepID=A0A1M5TKJ8_9FLAO|nr:CAP domain-containing protein [Winogradskyella jejuensis]SHH50873.1 Cysteine-rich secretory protein family protein [Winogradskyella jejuensis]
MKVSTLMPVLAICALLSFTSCSTESVNEEEVFTVDIATAPQAKPLEIEVLELINNHRINSGLNALSNNNTVKAVAFTHSDYMRQSNDVSHHNFYVRKQSLEENENAQIVSENVAYGYTNAESLVNAWLNSPSHRNNIEGNFTHFDISAEQDEDGGWYYTNIFIKR